MNWGWLFTAIRWILGLFGQGKGTRITVEARPEASIDAEKIERQKLADKLQEIDDELASVRAKIVAGKSRGADTSDLDKLRDKLLVKRGRAKTRYDNAL